MPRRIEDETGVANFIDPSERKSAAKPLTGRALEEETSRLYKSARPGNELSLGEEPVIAPPRRTAPKKAKPKNKIGPPGPSLTGSMTMTPLEPAAPSTLDAGPTPFVGAPLALPPEQPRPNLTPSQFSALGGAPGDFAGVQERLRALPPEAGQLVKPRPAGIDMDEVAKDVADATDNLALNPKLWAGAGIAGATAGLGLAGAGGLAGAINLGGAGGAATGLLNGGAPEDVAGEALTGGVLGGAGHAIGSALGKAAGWLRGSPVDEVTQPLTQLDDVTQLRPPPRAPAMVQRSDTVASPQRLPTEIAPPRDATQLLPGGSPGASQTIPGRMVPRDATQIIPGGSPGAIRGEILNTTPGVAPPPAPLNPALLENQPVRFPTPATETANIRAPVDAGQFPRFGSASAPRGSSLVQPQPLDELAPQGLRRNAVSQDFTPPNFDREPVALDEFMKVKREFFPNQPKTVAQESPFSARPQIGPAPQASFGPKSVAPGPWPTQTPQVGGLESLSGRVLRSPLAAGLLTSAAALGGAATGSGYPIGQGSAAPSSIEQPYASPRPEAVSRPEEIAPQGEEPVEELKPLIQHSGISHEDMAAGFAAKDGFDFKIISPLLKQKYMQEAAPYFSQGTGSGLRGGLLRGAEGLDSLLRGK